MGTQLLSVPASRGRFFIAVILGCILTIAAEARAQSEIKITGKIIDRPTGSPVPGARVSILSLGKYAISDEAGEFYFTDIPIGSYFLIAQRIGFEQSASIPVEIQGACPANIIISLDIKPVIVTGQNIISRKTSEMTINIRGNSTILEFSPGALESIESVIEKIPELELAGSGTQKLVRLRGSPTNAVVIMLDGRIQNSSLSSQGDISSIPLGEVTRIEIVKGGDYKSTGLAGSVNFITNSLERQKNLNASVSRGSFGHESYSLGLAQGDRAKISLDLKDSYTRGNFQFLDPRDSLETRENNFSHDLNFFGGLGIPIKTGRLDIKGRYFKRNAGVPGPIFQLSERSKSNSLEKEAYAIFDMDIGSGHGLGFIGGLSSRDIIYDSPQTPTNFIPYKSKFIEDTRDIKLSLTRKRTIELDSYISSRYETLNGKDYIRPTLSFGQHSKLVNTIGIGAAIPFPKVPIIEELTTLKLGLKREAGSGGLFWGPSGSIRLNVKGIGLDFSYFRSRRLPDLTDLFWKEDVFATPNPDLQPEKSQGYEIGLDCHSGRFGPCDFRVSRYNSRYNDIIIWRKWAGDKFKPENLSKAEINGWEISLLMKPLKGPITFFWNASLNRPLNKEDSPVHHNKYLTFRPVGSQNGGVEFEYLRTDIRISAQHLGRRYTTEENTKSLPPVELFDFRIGYELTINAFDIKGRFSVLNLGDKQYEILDRQPERPREYKFELELSRLGRVI